MTDDTTPRWRQMTLTGVRIFLALAFVSAGFAKLVGVPMMVSVFDHVGFGQWFRYLTGVVEISGAILLLIPRLAGVGGLLMATTMACAIASHLLAVPGSPAPAALLLTLSAIVAWSYRARTVALLGTTQRQRVPA